MKNKNSILILIILSTLYYANNFLYAFIETNYRIKGALELWSLSPFFFILFTTFVAESCHSKMFKEIRIKSLIELLLRIAAMFINFYATTFEFGQFEFNTLISIEVISMAIVIYLEIKMYNYVNKYIHDNKEIEDELLSNEEIDYVVKNYYYNNKPNLINLGVEDRKEIKNTFRLTSLVGYSKILILVLFLGISLGLKFFGKEYRMLILFISVIIFIGYLYLTNLKLNLFYSDKEKFNKIYIRDNLSLFLGLTILYVSEGIIYVNTGSFNLISYITAALFIAPTLATNKKISLKFHDINKKYRQDMNLDHSK